MKRIPLTEVPKGRSLDRFICFLDTEDPRADLRFAITIDFVTAQSRKISGQRITKMSLVKTVIDLNETDCLGLPLPMHDRIYRHGIFPPELEYWMYRNPLLTLDERTVDLANGLATDAIVAAQSLLGSETVNMIRAALEAQATKLGSAFRPQITLIGHGRIDQSLADAQLEDYVLRHVENFSNWVIDPAFVRFAGTSKVTRGFTVGGQLASTAVQREESRSDIAKAVETLQGIVKLLIRKVKPNLAKTNETWHFSVKDLNALCASGGEMWLRAQGQCVLFVGHFTGDELLFTDATYFRRRQDYVRVRAFPSMEIGDHEYILLGLVESDFRGPIIRPLGMVKRRGYLRAAAHRVPA